MTGPAPRTGSAEKASSQLEARIIAAANAWSAMTDQRTDRPTLSPDDALLELSRLAGTTLDPLVVQACQSILADPPTPG